MPDTESNRPIDIPGVPDFWDRARRARHAILFLDYDGTLAPFRVNRMDARPLEGIPEALDDIGRLDNTTVALISGRPVFEVLELAGIDDVVIAGTHGFELYEPGRGTHASSLSVENATTLDRAEEKARELAGPERTERKVSTVAIHTRGLDPDMAADLNSAFREGVRPFRTDEFEVRDFNGGVELRSRARNKGVAVRELLMDLPRSDLIVYIGDDDTDEDAFRALCPDGIGIRVGADEQPTAASGRLGSPEDVRRFLRDWFAIRSCQ